MLMKTSNNVNAAVVFVNYAPSPEAKYPVSLEQTYAACAYFSKLVSDET
jgi:acetyl esterase